MTRGKVSIWPTGAPIGNWPWPALLVTRANGYSDELIKSILEELLNADEEERGGRKRRGSRLLTRRSQSTKPKAQGINEEEVKVEVDGGSRGAGGCGCTVS